MKETIVSYVDSLVLLLPGLMLRKLPGLSSALLPGQSETLILHQRALCYDLHLRAEARSALRNRKAKVAHSLWLRSYQRSNSPALPLAIPALPHITELPLAFAFKEAAINAQELGKPDSHPKDDAHLSSRLRTTKSWKNAPTMTQGLSSVLMLPHLRCPSTVKRCWRLRELVTHILPFCPSFREPTTTEFKSSQESSSPHSAPFKRHHPLRFPRGGGKKKGRLLWVLAFPEGTRHCSHTNSNADEMSVPSTSLPFQADPAASWNNFPSLSQSFQGPFHWLGQSLPPPHAKPGFTYVKTTSIKIVGFFFKFLSLFWSQQRKDN